MSSNNTPRRGTLMKIVRRATLCLVVGGCFGWVISTKFPPPHAVVSAAAAGAFMYGGLVAIDRADRREQARRADEVEESDEA